MQRTSGPPGPPPPPRPLGSKKKHDEDSKAKQYSNTAGVTTETSQIEDPELYLRCSGIVESFYNSGTKNNIEIFIEKNKIVAETELMLYLASLQHEFTLQKNVGELPEELISTIKEVLESSTFFKHFETQQHQVSQSPTKENLQKINLLEKILKALIINSIPQPWPEELKSLNEMNLGEIMALLEKTLKALIINSIPQPSPEELKSLNEMNLDKMMALKEAPPKILERFVEIMKSPYPLTIITREDIEAMALAIEPKAEVKRLKEVIPEIYELLTVPSPLNAKDTAKKKIQDTLDNLKLSHFNAENIVSDLESRVLFSRSKIIDANGDIENLVTLSAKEKEIEFLLTQGIPEKIASLQLQQQILSDKQNRQLDIIKKEISDLENLQEAYLQEKQYIAENKEKHSKELKCKQKLLREKVKLDVKNKSSYYNRNKLLKERLIPRHSQSSRNKNALHLMLTNEEPNLEYMMERHREKIPMVLKLKVDQQDERFFIFGKDAQNEPQLSKVSDADKAIYAAIYAEINESLFVENTATKIDVMPEKIKENLISTERHITVSKKEKNELEFFVPIGANGNNIKNLKERLKHILSVEEYNNFINYMLKLFSGETVDLDYKLSFSNKASLVKKKCFDELWSNIDKALATRKKLMTPDNKRKQTFNKVFIERFFLTEDRKLIETNQDGISKIIEIEPKKSMANFESSCANMHRHNFFRQDIKSLKKNNSCKFISDYLTQKEINIILPLVECSLTKETFNPCSKKHNRLLLQALLKKMPKKNESDPHLEDNSNFLLVKLEKALDTEGARKLIRTERPFKWCESPGISARKQAASEQAAREQAHREQVAREQAPPEQVAREQAHHEQVAREQAPPEQAASEQAPPEQVAREQAPPEQAASEQAPPEQVAREQAPREQVANEQAPRRRVTRRKAPRRKLIRRRVTRRKAPRKQVVSQKAISEEAVPPEQIKRAQQKPKSVVEIEETLNLPDHVVLKNNDAILLQFLIERKNYLSNEYFEKLTNPSSTVKISSIATGTNELLSNIQRKLTSSFNDKTSSQCNIVKFLYQGNTVKIQSDNNTLEIFNKENKLSVKAEIQQDSIKVIFSSPPSSKEILLAVEILLEQASLTGTKEFIIQDFEKFPEQATLFHDYAIFCGLKPMLYQNIYATSKNDESNKKLTMCM